MTLILQKDNLKKVIDLYEKEILVTCKNGYWFKGGLIGEILDQDTSIEETKERFMSRTGIMILCAVQGFGTETLFGGQALEVAINLSDITSIALTEPDYIE